MKYRGHELHSGVVPGEPYQLYTCRLCWLWAHADNPDPRGPHPFPGKSPGLFARAKSFAKALARHVKAGCPTVPTEEQSRRLALCVVCPHYAVKGTCDLCGCRLKTKVSWSLECCPIGKW